MKIINLHKSPVYISGYLSTSFLPALIFALFHLVFGSEYKIFQLECCSTLKKEILEFLLRSTGIQVQSQAQRSGLRILHCCSCSLGLDCSSDLTPGPGTPYAWWWPKKKKKRKERKRNPAICNNMSEPRRKHCCVHTWVGKEFPDFLLIWERRVLFL